MISVGDLVVVVKQPHACLMGIGAMFVVTRIGKLGPTRCGRCHRPLPDDAPVYGHPRGPVALSRLRKIDPQKQPDAIPTAQPEEVAA